MPQLDIVAIGASAGGLEALLEIASRLPRELPAAILVVLHTRTEGESYLPQILSRKSRLPVAFAAHGKSPRRGHIYVARPDLHLRVGPGGMLLGGGPKENGFRPAIDPLLRSVAREYGPRGMGVILSGALDDGTYGLKVLKEAGGICVAQDPNEASLPSMPLSVIRFVGPDHVLPAASIADLIGRLAGTPVEGEDGMAPTNELEPQNPAEETPIKELQKNLGPPSGLTCPDCGGALWELHNGQLMRYRCHVGHQFNIEALDAEQHDAVEAALWTAVRVLEEHGDLRERLSRRADESGMSAVSESFAESARDSHQQANTIRDLLHRRAPPPRPSATTTAREKTLRGRKTRTRRG